MGSLMKRLGFGTTRMTQDPTRIIEAEDSSPTGSTAGVEVRLPETEKDKIEAITTGAEAEALEWQANRRLSLFKEANKWDPNIGNDTFDDIDEALDTTGAERKSSMVGDVIDNSPYIEVRAAVRNYDIDVPVSTIRAWVIGMVLCTVGSGLNALFTLRAPAITITSVVAQLVAYPLGVGWTWIMPNRTFKTFGREWNFNPGPFNIKEHTLIVVMANASFGNGAAYFTDTIVAQRGFYNQSFGWGFNILFALSTQIVGFGLAGLARRFLVEPGSMIWPSQLVNSAFMYALHDHSKTDPAKTNGWSISRYRWFFYVFLGSFVWYWFPGYLCKFLSVFAFVTWIKPNNVVINQVFGGWTGLGLIPLSFDWTQITGYIYSPLIPPWHAIANTLIGTVIFFWITSAAVHFSGHWYAAHLPMSDSNSWDNTGAHYNVSRILTPEFTLDLAEYKTYSPLFLSTTFALTYGLSFASIAAVIVHTALFHGKDLWIRARSSRLDLDDIHSRLMRKYPRVPDWWFAILLAVMIGVAFAASYAYPTHLTWWALIVAFLISAFWLVPIGMVQATTNVSIGLNVFSEFLIGYMLPGRPIAMMMFKTYGYITMRQAIAFSQDLKLGHYMKVPQRSLFWGQFVATVWACFVQLATIEWGLSNVAGVCSSTQPNNFTCPNARVFFNASVIWGLIGPARIFSPGALYSSLLWFWLAGTLLPIAIYAGARAFPRSPIRFLSAPILFGGMGEIPPATPLNYMTWGIVGFVFQKLLRNKKKGWWMRFNYVTSAGLDSGLAICTIVIIAALNLTNTAAPSWWGNKVEAGTLDYKDLAIQQPIPKGQTFGPKTW